MALYYNLVFSLLITEIALFTILCLPIPSKIRKPLVTVLAKPFQLPAVQVTIKCVLVFILVLFADALNRVKTINSELFNAKYGTSSSITVDRIEIQSRRFYAQRNMYLTGFTLFLTLVLSRTYALVGQLLQLKESYRAPGKVDLSRLPIEKTARVEELKEKIRETEESIAILKSQAEALSKEYEAVAK